VSGPVGRAAAGYRIFRDTDVHTLRFIRHACDLGSHSPMGSLAKWGRGGVGEETREIRGILYGVISGAVLWFVMICVAAVL
jgi:hypothetical protein